MEPFLCMLIAVGVVAAFIIMAVKSEPYSRAQLKRFSSEQKQSIVLFLYKCAEADEIKNMTGPEAVRRIARELGKLD